MTRINKKTRSRRCIVKLDNVRLLLLLFALPLFVAVQFLALLHGHPPTLSAVDVDRRSRKALVPLNIKRKALAVERRDDVDHRHYPKQQRIVLLAGPHKTGSTSVQSNMVEWTSNNVVRNWTWAMPQAQQLEEINMYGLTPPKRFAPLLATLRNSTLFVKNHRQLALPTKAKVLQVYQEAFRKSWKQGNNIVFGAEAIDFVVDESRNGTAIMDDLRELWSPLIGEKQQQHVVVVNVVVTYRAPRVDHLVSLWHELGKKGQTLSNFIRNNLLSSIFKINAMELAYKFAHDAGFSTTIIDTSGLKRRNLDLSNTVACNVLKVPCHASNNTIIGLKGKPRYANRKRGPGTMDLDATQLKMIDDILNRFDCQFQNSTKQDNVEILYPEAIFRNCTTKQVKEEPFFSMKNAVQEIIKIIE